MKMTQIMFDAAPLGKLPQADEGEGAAVTKGAESPFAQLLGRLAGIGEGTLTTDEVVEGEEAPKEEKPLSAKEGETATNLALLMLNPLVAPVVVANQPEGTAASDSCAATQSQTTTEAVSEQPSPLSWSGVMTAVVADNAGDTKGSLQTAAETMPETTSEATLAASLPSALPEKEKKGGEMAELLMAADDASQPSRSEERPEVGVKVAPMPLHSSKTEEGLQANATNEEHPLDLSLPRHAELQRAKEGEHADMAKGATGSAGEGVKPLEQGTTGVEKMTQPPAVDGLLALHRPSSVEGSAVAEVVSPHKVTPEAIVSQLKDGVVSKHEDGSSRITVRLQPKELGELTISVRLDEQRLRVEVMAENQSVKNLLERNQDLLRDALSRQNLMVERFTVGSNGSDGQLQNQQSTGFNRHPNSGQQGKWGGYLTEESGVNQELAYLDNGSHSLVNLRL
jgi:flagellar hook-length control protein FliK